MKESSDGFFRADRIDLKSLDEQLERHLNRVLTLEKSKIMRDSETNFNIILFINLNKNTTTASFSSRVIVGRHGIRIRHLLLVTFSPVLVLAVIALSLIIMGFLTSGGFGVASVIVVTWIYRYATGKQPPSADQLDSAR
ncbi:hypothetical protein FF1_017539 [Malus domestica]